MRVLAADVGGTKTLLALFEDGREVASYRVVSGDFGGIAPILHGFLTPLGSPPIDAAAIAVAGPVFDDVCRATNLPWWVDARAIERDLAIPSVRLLNDFEAVAIGVFGLREDQLHALQSRPRDPRGPIAIVGAGTGLGEAIVLPGDPSPRVIPTEGGHADFAPRTAREIELLQYLLERHAHVSVERAVSGLGLATIFEFVVARGLAVPTEALRARLASVDDPGAAIGPAGAANADPAAALALSIFVALYGAEAGNFALKTLPSGGLFIAGGIAPKILDVLAQGEFIRHFRAKGRMEPVLDRIHVAVVTEPRVGLLGAARFAVDSSTRR